MTLLREHTTAVRDLLHGNPVTVDGRFVHLDGVTLDWPPAEVPPVLVGARGDRTLRLAGEIADGVILDSGHPPDEIRAQCALVARGRAGRSGPFRTVAYVELDATSSTLDTQVADAARAYGAAGADTVVLVAGAGAPDPAPLSAACGRQGAGTG
jgi:hypothetical protein